MADLELKVDPDFVEKFRKLGGALVELGGIIEKLDSLLQDMTPLMDSLQGLMTEITADLNIAQTPSGASRATRTDAGRRAALSAASVFYVMSQVPGIFSLMTELSSLGDFNSLTSEQRKELAMRLREEGRKLQELSRPASVKAVPTTRLSKAVRRKSKS